MKNSTVVTSMTQINFLSELKGCCTKFTGSSDLRKMVNPLIVPSISGSVFKSAHMFFECFTEPPLKDFTMVWKYSFTCS